MRLDLTFLYPGVFSSAAYAAAPAAGQTATPPGPPTSMYNLTNLPSGATLSSTLAFTMSGNAVRISTGETTPFTGVFTMQFGVPYQNLAATWATGASVQSSFSATFNVIPEPATALLLSLGALPLLQRRHRRP